MIQQGTIALAGSGGSHPATIAAVARELVERAPGRGRAVIDLSPLDRRGTGDYAHVPAELIQVGPAELGLRRVFKTAAPNLVISGGVRRYDAAIAWFEWLLVRLDVRVLLLCHAWGLPEQALLEAARRSGVRVAQIDEGPFSYPIRPRGAPEFSPGLKGQAMRLLRHVGALPPRDLTGDKVDLFFATSPGRGGILRERGLPAERLSVVPCPRFDPLAELASRWRERPVGRRRRILFVHQPFRRDGKVRAREAARAERALVEALKLVSRRRTSRVTLRLHPRTDPVEAERLERLFDDAGISPYASEGDGFSEELLRHDMVVGFYSSGLLEAAACGAPAVSSRLNPFAFRERFEGRKAATIETLGIPTADEPERLAKLIVAGLDARIAEPSAELIETHIGELNGRGAATVADQLIRLGWP